MKGYEILKEMTEIKLRESRNLAWKAESMITFSSVHFHFFVKVKDTVRDEFENVSFKKFYILHDFDTN